MTMHRSHVRFTKLRKAKRRSKRRRDRDLDAVQIMPGRAQLRYQAGSALNDDSRRVGAMINEARKIA